MEKKLHRGVPLALIYSILTVASLLLTITVFITTSISQSGFDQIERLTDGYLHCASDVLQLDETSDYLTSRSREFVATGNKVAAARYVTEMKESMSRERALENVRLYFADTIVYTDLTNALNFSNELAEREYYAMRLAADYYGLEDIPGAIKETELTTEDASKTVDEKRSYAIEMVYGEEYLNLKKKIDDSVAACLNDLINITEARKKSASDSINQTVVFHNIVLGTLLISMVASALSTWFLALRPLRRTKECIDENLPIKVRGSSEIRYVAAAYNHMYEENKRQKDILEYEVSHDILTGISNRHDYVDTCNRLADQEVLFIIADIDRFKSINDTLGHAMGDAVISEVARRLRESFLNHDKVFRIGGDEFVVMVFDCSEKRKAEIKDILIGLNNAFVDVHNRQPSFPLVSLSFGVTHKRKAVTFEAAYRNADKALYAVKERGGCDANFDAQFTASLKKAA